MASDAGSPVAIAGRMADERTLVLTFDRALAVAGEALALPTGSFRVNGQSGGVAEAYAEDREVFVVLGEMATGDYVDVSVAADTVFGAGIVAGSGNAAVGSYRIVTGSGALKLKNELDPDGGGFALADAVAYMNRLKAARSDANIAGLAGLDGTDVRLLLSLLDLGVPDRRELQGAIAQADALLAATVGHANDERSRLSASRDHALTVAGTASSTQRAIDEARVRVESSMAAFKPVGAQYRTVRGPLSVGLAPGSLLADGVYNEADRRQLGAGDNAVVASLRVVLPAAKGGFDDYRMGDELVLKVGETSYTYTLKASDVARMKRVGEAASFDFDVASFLRGEAADVAAISYSAFVRNGANASQSSEPVGNAAAEAFGIDLAPIIETAPDRVVQGEPIAVTVNDPQAKVYLTKDGMETDLAFACNEGECSLTTSAIEAGGYEIYAKDASGQASDSRKIEIAAKPAPLPPAAISLSLDFPVNEEGQYVFNRQTSEGLGWSEERVAADIELPGNRDAETDYGLGDRVVVEFRGGEGNLESFVHELNGDEIGALNNAASEETVTVSIDVTSYFLNDKLPDDTIEVAAHVQDAEVDSAKSASARMANAIWIERTVPVAEVSTGDVIGQPAAELIPLDGGRIVARSSELGAIYAIPWALVEVAGTVEVLDDIVSRGFGRKQAFTGDLVTFPASSLGIGDFVVLAVDKAGNVSVPISTISIDDMAAPELTVKTGASGEQGDAIPLEGGRIWASSTEAGTIYAVLASQVPAEASKAALDDLVTRAKGLKRSFTEADVVFEAGELGVGEYVFFAVDGRKNVSEPSRAIAIRDTSAPTLTVTTSEDVEGSLAQIVSQTATISAISTEAGKIYAVRASQVPVGVDKAKLDQLVTDGYARTRDFTASSVAFEAGELGLAEYVLFAVDQAGNVSAPSAAIAIRDLMAPTLTVLTSEDGEGGMAEVISQAGFIQASSTEAGTIYAVLADEVTNRTAEALEDLVADSHGVKLAFMEGEVTFKASELHLGRYVLFAVDAAGNVSDSSDVIEIQDLTAPTLTVSTSEDGESGVADAISQAGSINAHSSETGTIYAVVADKVTTRTVGALEDLVASSDGAKRTFMEGQVTFKASELRLAPYVLFAVDEAGNVSEPSDVIEIKDLTAPTLTVTTNEDDEDGLADVISLENGQIMVSSSEQGTIYVYPWAYVEWARNAEQLEILVREGTGYKQAYTGTEVTFAAASLKEGYYVVRAVDKAGNVSPPTSTIQIKDEAPTLTYKTNESGEQAAVISLEKDRIWASGNEAGTIYAVLQSELPTNVTAAALDNLITLEQGLKRSFSSGYAIFNANELGEGEYVLYAVDEAGKVSAPSSAITVEDMFEPELTVRTSEEDLTVSVPLEEGRIWASSTEASTIYAVPSEYAYSEMTTEALSALVSDYHWAFRLFTEEDVEFEASDLGEGEFVFYAVDEAGKISAPSESIWIEANGEPDVTAPTLTISTSEDVEGQQASSLPYETGWIQARSNESGAIYAVYRDDYEFYNSDESVTADELKSIVEERRGLKGISREGGVTFSARELGEGYFVLIAVDRAGNVSTPSSEIYIYYEGSYLELTEESDTLWMEENVIHLPIGMTAGELSSYFSSSEEFAFYKYESDELSPVNGTAVLTENNVIIVQAGLSPIFYYLDFHTYVVKTAYHDADVAESPTHLTVDAPLMIKFNEMPSEYARSQIEDAFINASNGRELGFDGDYDENGEYVLTISLAPMPEGEEDPGVEFANNITAKLFEAESATDETLLEVEPVEVELSPNYELGEITLTFSSDLSARLLEAESLDSGIIEEILFSAPGEVRGSLTVDSVKLGEAPNQLVVAFSNWDEFLIEDTYLVALRLKFSIRSVDTADGRWVGNDYFALLPQL